MTRSTKRALVAAALLFCPLGSRAQAKAPTNTMRDSRPKTHYYIATQAMLRNPELVDVFGSSNLPPGSVLIVYISNYIGDGSTLLNTEERVTVGTNGLFRAQLHPKGHLEFRTNMVCLVSFGPDYPSQPDSVIKVVGDVGQYLGAPGALPQVEGNSRVTGLADYTIVRE